MSATIIAFPPVPVRSPVSPVLPAADLATKFTDHFLPIVQASIDLLEADNQEIERRCSRMLDTDGSAMVDDLCREFEIVGRQMQILVDGLELTRSRLRTAVANAPTRAEIHPLHPGDRLMAQAEMSAVPVFGRAGTADNSMSKMQTVPLTLQPTVLLRPFKNARSGLNSC